MKLQNQVCSLSQTKRLEELGIETFSLYHWWDNNAEPFVDECAADTEHPWLNDLGAAFTVSELGQMLSYENVPYFSTEYDMWILPKGSKLKGQGLGSINEAIIRAELLIYALENKLLSAETCNSRLAE